jgi:hypothetical protein
MNNQRGAILAVTLGFVLIFILLGLGAIYLGTVQNEAAEKRTASNKAFWLAEAGLQKALWEYNNNSCRGLYRKNGSASCPNTTACTSCTSCGTGDKCLYNTVYDSAGTVAQGDYDVVLNDTNNVIVSKGWYINRPAGAASPPDVNCPALGCRIVQLDSGSQFQYAFFAKTSINFGNNASINSYDSNNGPYGGSNISSNGDIGTNGTAVGAITINNGVTINGDASTGPGGTIGGGGTVTGNTSNTNNTYLSPVTIPSSLTSLTNLGNLNVNSTTTIPAGDYKYNSVNIGNNKTLVFDGNVRLYLTSTTTGFSTGNGFQIVLNSGAKVSIYGDGKILFSSNSSLSNVNDAGKSENFQVFSTYTGSGGVVVSNNGNFFGTVYAPGTDVSVTNNTALYGAIVGNTISVENNGTFHYDEALAGTVNNANKKWREL